MWIFHDFPLTHILREINFGEARSAKFAILIQLGVSAAKGIPKIIDNFQAS